MNQYSRIFSGIKPIDKLHIGHYHGIIKHWLDWQYEHECFFMVADLHALATKYIDPKDIKFFVKDMVINWLATGVDPSQATIFVQSQIPEHYQLHLLLSMITPLSWLERELGDKDRHIDNMSFSNQDTYGLLGYSLLQSVDMLLYDAKYAGVVEEQVSRVELTREIARRFNHLYGREFGFEEKARASIKKLGAKKADLYEVLLTAYQQEGDEEALDKARYLLADAVNLSLGEQERLFAFLENKSKVIMSEPQEIIYNSNLLLGLDGQGESRSANNVIYLREGIDSINRKIRSMPTDPARVRITDVGNPDKCPVWELHKIYSDSKTCEWVRNGCVTAGIGCLECKKPLIEAIDIEQQKILANASPYLEDDNLITNILADGAERAQEIAAEKLIKIKEEMSLNY